MSELGQGRRSHAAVRGSASPQKADQPLLESIVSSGSTHKVAALQPAARGLAPEQRWRHCQLKPPWYALRVGGAAARVGELLCSPSALPALKPSGAKKGA